MGRHGVSKSTLQRLPAYLSYLKSMPGTTPTISATALAAALGMGEVQVRKDLASVSDAGKPRVGYVRSDLVETLERFLGYDGKMDAVLVGAGSLGRALLSYQGFEGYGLRITAAFDVAPALIGATVCGRQVYPVARLKDYCRTRGIPLGILTVPGEEAQGACDLLISAGVQAVWNFAPVHLNSVPGVLVQNENIASSLALLSRHLSERLHGEQQTG